MTTKTPTWFATPDAKLQINSVAVTPDGQLSVCGTSSEFGSGSFSVCGYDQTGKQLFSTPVTPAHSTQGVFWVAVSNDKRFVAAGGETSKTQGFLTLCSGTTGDVLSQLSVASRVNQLSFDSSGAWLLAAYSTELQLYSTAGIAASPQSLQLSSTVQVPAGMDCYSALISADATWVWCSGINYTTKTGCVQLYAVSNGQLQLKTQFDFAVGVMRVAISADGQFAAAALHDGSCALLQAGSSSPCWHYQPSFASLSVAYAVAVTVTSKGQVVVACGANAASSASAAPAVGGYLYLLAQNQSDLAPAQPSLLWQQGLEYAANPGVSLDTEASVVTATDGKPNEQNGGNNQNESPGNFYLFNAASGELLWQYATTVMNWPMVVTPDAQVALGGSDDGSMYYWKL